MGSKGLMVDDATDLLDFQQPYARRRAEVAGWASGERGIGLAEVVARVHPTMLIGTSTHAGAFTEAIVKDMAAHTERPIIMPLSNPTSKAEALPADLIAWTDGKVLTATGSPFGPVAARGPESTRSRRPTTRWCSPGSGWASLSPRPPGSVIG